MIHRFTARLFAGVAAAHLGAGDELVAAAAQGGEVLEPLVAPAGVAAVVDLEIAACPAQPAALIAGERGASDLAPVAWIGVRAGWTRAKFLHRHLCPKAVAG